MTFTLWTFGFYMKKGIGESNPTKDGEEK